MPYVGEVVFQRVFDLGGTFDMKKVRSILGAMAEAPALKPTRSAPEYVSFAAPILLNLSSMNLSIEAEDGTPGTVSARLYEVGALGVMLRFPIRAECLADLSRYHNLPVKVNGQSGKRSQVAYKIYDALKPKLIPAREEEFDIPVDSEVYTAFCLTEATGGAETVFARERAEIAGLLTNEPQPQRLSQMEIDDTTKNWTSYYKDDIIVADWDAALLIEPDGHYEDTLYIFEVANLQLLALRKYDIYLDMILERGHEAFEKLTKGAPIFTGQAKDMVTELSTVKMDLAEVTDEVANTAKFFGDWYAARLYTGLASKLHINDYHRTVEEKLETLNELYKSVLAEIDRRQNIVLETSIVVLIILEIAMAIFWKH